MNDKSFESAPARKGYGVFSKLFSFFRYKKKTLSEKAENTDDVFADFAERIARQSNPESKKSDCLHIALTHGLPPDIRQAAETSPGNIEIVNINSPEDYPRIAECHLGITSQEYEDCNTFLHVCTACSTVPVLTGEIQPGSLAEVMNTLGFLTPVGSAAGLQHLISRHLFDSVYHNQLAAWALDYHKELLPPFL